MEKLFFVEMSKLQKVKEILLKDELVSRASIVFKDAKMLTGKEGHYCYISGLEEQCDKALKILKKKDL